MSNFNAKQENPDDIFGEEGTSKTAFNSALDIIQRISRLEYSLTASLLEGDLSSSYKLLVLIHTEIDFKLQEEERNELDQLELKIYKRLSIASERYSHGNNLFFKNSQVYEEVMNEIIELKKKISRLKYKVGLGMIDLSDPRYALLNG